MLSKILKSIQSALLISVSKENQSEFTAEINRINVSRARITAGFLAVLELFQFLALLILKENYFLKTPNIYYGFLFLLFFIIMSGYFIIFSKLSNNILKYRKIILVSGIAFIGIILLRYAGVSLLDQDSSGQIITYTMAMMAIAVTPIYRPTLLLVLYLIIHTIFLILLPHYQKNSEVLFWNCVNSTVFVIVSWFISYMRYKKHMTDFNNKKIIQKNKEELERVNRELEQANSRLKELSYKDGLTGVYNRFAFDKMIRTEWDRCRRYFIPLSLLMIDIDLFKAFNDEYGHQGGDQCLRQIAGILSACAKRSSDTVARYGGEEFAIILPHMEKERALPFAEKVRKMVEELAIPHGHTANSEFVTISVGVNTIVPSRNTSLHDFIRATDLALYRAKESRNRICSWTGEGMLSSNYDLSALPHSSSK